MLPSSRSKMRLYMERGPAPRYYVGEIGGGMGVNYDMLNIGPRVSI